MLGLLLWNLAYDVVVCYADDTLILVRGLYFEEVRRLAEQRAACVVGKICELSLRVAPKKIKALRFHGLRKRQEPPSLCLRVGDRHNFDYYKAFK